MKIAILLRTDEAVSLFRKALLKIGSIPGEEFYICSGTLTDVSKDLFLFNSIRAGFISVSAPKLITLGMKESTKCKKTASCSCNFCKYKNLATALKADSLSSSYSYRGLVEKDMKWHSKIALKVRNGEVIAAIIGSSNLTIPAYGQKGEKWVGSTFNFPYECDVLIWDENKIRDIFASNPDIGVDFTQSNIITATPDNDIRPLLKQQLQEIRDLVSSETAVFDILN